MATDYNPHTGLVEIVRREWDLFIETVPAGQTLAVDSVPNDCFKAIRYQIAAENVANNAYLFRQMSALNNSGNYRDSVSDRLGSGVNLNIDFFNNAGTFELRLTNNELFDLEVSIGRLILA